MSLLKPTLGELFDRLLIVQLKLNHASPSDVDRWETLASEISELHVVLAFKYNVTVNAELISPATYEVPVSTDNYLQMTPLVAHLREVHRQLWNIEDGVRTLIKSQRGMDALGKYCVSIATLNDERAILVRALSGIFGENVAPKSYSANEPSGLPSASDLDIVEQEKKITEQTA